MKVAEYWKDARVAVFLPWLRHEAFVLSHSTSSRSARNRVPRRPQLTTPEDASLIDILDRVLDRGIVIEPAARLRLASLNLPNRYEHFVIDRKEIWLSGNKRYQGTH